MLTVSDDGLAMIRHYEGCKLAAYRDAVGIWTIGYGDTANVRPGLTITQADADERLSRRVATEFCPGVLAALSIEAAQCEIDAMVCLAYNIGVSAFAGSTLVMIFNAGGDAADQFLRWDKAGGVSLLGLRRRRSAERARFMGATLAEALRIGDQAT